jgi:hypothetical protein
MEPHTIAAALPEGEVVPSDASLRDIAGPKGRGLGQPARDHRPATEDGLKLVGPWLARNPAAAGLRTAGRGQSPLPLGQRGARPHSEQPREPMEGCRDDLHIALACPVLTMSSRTAPTPVWGAWQPWRGAAGTRLTLRARRAAVRRRRIAWLPQVRAELARPRQAGVVAALSIAGATAVVVGQAADARHAALHRGRITTRQVLIHVVIARAAAGS